MLKPSYWPDNLTLGYDKELFPSFFIDKFGQYTGTLLQIWNEIQLSTIGNEYVTDSQVSKYDFVFDDNDGDDDNDGFDGIFGAIDSGEVLSCINGLSLVKPGMIKSFRYSSPVFYQTINFYRHEPDEPSAASNLSFFLVFWPDEITTHHALSRAILSLSRSVIFPMAITFLFIIYSAAFRGNMVRPYVSPIVTFSDMLTNIRAGKWSLLTTIGMTDEETDAFSEATDGATAEKVESANQMIEACSSDQIVIRIFDIERAIQLTMDQNCPIQKIAPTTGHDESLRVMLTQNGDTLPYFLLFSRTRTSRRVVDYVNYALRMFSEDQIDNFWNVRFMRERGAISIAALKRSQKPAPDLQRYDPITLPQISPVFGLAISAVVFSIVVFLVELFVDYVKPKISLALRKKRRVAGGVMNGPNFPLWSNRKMHQSDGPVPPSQMANSSIVHSSDEERLKLGSVSLPYDAIYLCSYFAIIAVIVLFTCMIHWRFRKVADDDIFQEEF